MGHYRAEMMCPKCAFYVCRCPAKSILEQPMKWIVDRNWSIFKKRLNLMDLYVYKTKAFATREEAEAAVPDLIRAKINEHEVEIDMLKMILDLKPGETNICPKCFEPFHGCFCGGGYR